MQYDPTILVQYADRLYSQANSIIVLGTMAGAVVGLLAGAATVGVIGPVGLVMGGVFFGVLGFALGRERAFRYKLEAQRVLCELQTEINTRPRAPTA